MIKKCCKFWSAPYTWRSCLVLGAAGDLCPAPCPAPAPAMWVWILAMMYSELFTDTGSLLRSGICTCCCTCSAWKCCC